MAMTEVFQQVLSQFSMRHLRLAFAYGSGVFQQHGHKDMSKNMLDFIFSVDDPLEWHRENLEKNPGHYSSLKHLGPKYITHIQERFGAAIYFNTLVPWKERLIKYGVISNSALQNDLLDWNTLYVAGRLHKPVNILHRADDQSLTSALLSNHQSALHVSFLLLPEEFTEEQLYMMVTSLSYAGDFRMIVGEDKNKVANIVRPNIDYFRDLYEPLLESEQHIHWDKSRRIIEQSLCTTSRYHHLNLLPKAVILGLVAHRNRDGHFHDVEDVIRDVAHDGDCSDLVHQCVCNIVKQSSLSQSLKGILTAGVRKTIRYSLGKLTKMRKSKT